MNRTNIRSILVVDSESITAADIKIVLESTGAYQAYIAHTGVNALGKAFEMLPDVLVIDADLRGGLSAAEVAVQIKGLLRIPVIYIVSSMDCRTICELETTGPVGYILKPFGTANLLETVGHAVSGRKNDLAVMLKERMGQLGVTPTRSYGPLSA